MEHNPSADFHRVEDTGLICMTIERFMALEFGGIAKTQKGTFWAYSQVPFVVYDSLMWVCHLVFEDMQETLFQMST